MASEDDRQPRHPPGREPERTAAATPGPAPVDVFSLGEPSAPLRAGEFHSGAVRAVALRLSGLRLDLAGCFNAAIERERETGSLLNFVPVLLGLGILAYFAAPAEPMGIALIVSALVAAGLAMRHRLHGALYHFLVAAALLLTGMSAAKIRAGVMDIPAVTRQMTTRISGIVIAVDRNSRGSPRYLIRPQHIEGLEDARLPERIRLSASAGRIAIAPGEPISGKARIMPISGPAFPGGYDFNFFARFDRLGGTGFFLGAPIRPSGAGRPGLRDALTVSIARLRTALAGRIRAGLGGEPGDVAVALITGDRSGIDEATAESLRRSGLAHVLAISGLHMALVALTVVAAIRWLLAWVPALALNHPIRKWAAGAGLAAASLYLVVSGASVATQRAWIMIAVMLVATLADRRAVTIRNVAIAATAILLMSPESMLEPGFQMSFAAAGALVAAYEAWTGHMAGRRGSAEGLDHGVAARLLRSVPGYFFGIMFTSLVAGLATGLFAAWHFHRVAPLGLVTNVMAMPLVTLAIMPLALLSAVLMPYGIEKLALTPLGWAIDRMIAISDWVNGFDFPGVTGVQPVSVLAAGSAGLITLTLLRSRLRLLGLAPLACLPLLTGHGPAPDILVSEGGRAIAISDRSGGLGLLYPRRDRFVSDIWLRAWSGGTEGDRSAISADCDRDQCAARLRTGHLLLVVYDPDRLGAACETADILIAPRLRWVNCRARKPLLVLKRGDFEEGGSHAVWISAASEGRTQPPPSAAGAEKPHATAPRPAGPPPVPEIRVVAARPAGKRPWNLPLEENDDDGRPAEAPRHDGQAGTAAAGRTGQ